VKKRAPRAADLGPGTGAEAGNIRYANQGGGCDVDKPADEAVTSEVERRLDDIFGAEEEDQQAFLESGPLAQDSPLRNLKGVVLSIDWEITDAIMDSFLEEIERLQAVYEGDKIAGMFLQLLGSVGKHIRSQKARAHPDAIRVLNSVYNCFEKVLLDPEMPEGEKRKWLYGEVNRFKQLKEEIARGRAREAPKPVPQPPAADEPTAPEAEEPPVRQADLSGMPPHEAFAYALEEIKQVIKAEFQALRAELRLWREGR
jgi:hypothetical protein